MVAHTRAQSRARLRARKTHGAFGQVGKKLERGRRRFGVGVASDQEGARTERPRACPLEQSWDDACAGQSHGRRVTDALCHRQASRAEGATTDVRRTD